jgi:hypothetical protein
MMKNMCGIDWVRHSAPLGLLVSDVHHISRSFTLGWHIMPLRGFFVEGIETLMPVGVCQKCRERYYRGAVLERLEELAGHEELFKEKIQVPRFDFAAVIVF